MTRLPSCLQEIRAMAVIAGAATAAAMAVVVTAVTAMVAMAVMAAVTGRTFGEAEDEVEAEVAVNESFLTPSFPNS